MLGQVGQVVSREGNRQLITGRVVGSHRHSRAGVDLSSHREIHRVETLTVVTSVGWDRQFSHFRGRAVAAIEIETILRMTLAALAGQSSPPLPSSDQANAIFPDEQQD